MVMKTVKLIKPTKPRFPAKIRVAAYARVSVQGELNAHSLNAQTDYYTKLIENNPRWVNVGVFSDYGLTGTNADRPGFKTLMSLCDAGKVDLVLVKSISRFCRNTVDLLNTTRHLKDLNIDVRFEKENIDSISPDGELMLTLLASFAQEESRSTSENIRWAIKKGFENGKVHNVVQYGYDWDGKHFHINEEEANVIRQIYALYLEGRSPQQIVSLFEQTGITSRGGKHFSYSHVWKALRSEHYIGDSLLQKTYCPDFLTQHYVKNVGQADRYYVTGTHPAIIDKETWNAVQKEIERREELGYLANQGLGFSCFTSKVFCGKCGHTYRRRMTGTKNRNKLYKWICGTKIDGTSKVCDAQNISEKQLYMLTAEVLECENFTKELFDSKIEKIVVTASRTLTFYLKDGNTVDKRWVVMSTNPKYKEVYNDSNNNSCNANQVLI